MNKSDIEIQILCIFTYRWNLKTKQINKIEIDREKIVISREDMDKVGEGD